MAKTTKKNKAAHEVYEHAKTYPLSEALEIMSKFPKARFDETVELSVHLGVDPRQSTQMVRGVVDLPKGSYSSPGLALENAGRLMSDGGAHMVKLEGGATMAATVEYLADHDIPVCGHIGLLPQSVSQPGDYRVQGREAAAAAAILADAHALQDAGASLLVMECIPAQLGAAITAAVSIPTIGIGAGPDCDGQVLVLHDMLGITTGKLPRFVQDFLPDAGSISIRGKKAFSQSDCQDPS